MLEKGMADTAPAMETNHASEHGGNAPDFGPPEGRRWGPRAVPSFKVRFPGPAVLGWSQRLRSPARLQGLLNAVSEILFLRGSSTGLILITVTLLNPQVGVAGLVAVAAAMSFAHLAGIRETAARSNVHLYNPLLTGLCVGLLLGLQPLGLLIAATAGVLTIATSVMLNGIFDDYLKLPVLSLPFVLVSSAVWLAFGGQAGQDIATAGIETGAAWMWLPPWLDGMLTSLGTILFTPHPAAGLILALVILRHSRILFGLTLSGYLLGAAVSQALAGDTAGISELNYFNHSLVAMSIGGVFLVPSLRSYAIAAIAVTASALVLAAAEAFAGRFALPVFTMPFNIVTLTFLYFLGRAGSPVMARTLHDTPEATLDHHLSHRRRFGDPQPELILPFSGGWTLWQGFDGPWTHTGPWQHACDFIITRPASNPESRTLRAPNLPLPLGEDRGEGNHHGVHDSSGAGERHDGYTGTGSEAALSYSGTGQHLDDYHAWRKPVLAPCSGRVIQVISDLPDNPPGHVDNQNHWGNLVIIESPQGWFAELSHFAKGSIAVHQGDQVTTGQLLGLCGNSGYSAQPHIHLQVQAKAQVGAATQPFRFLSFLESNRFTARGLPAVGGEVQPLPADRGLQYRMTLPLGETLRYRLVDAERSAGTLKLTARMDTLGGYYLDSGRGRLYFALDASGFYFYRMDGDDPWLAMMFQALPQLPLGYARDMTWSDSVPLATLERGWRLRVLELLSAVTPRARENQYLGRWVAEGVVEGRLSRAYTSRTQLSRVVLSRRMGFSEVRVGDRLMSLEGEHPRMR